MKILLGVTGSIAAYKTFDLARDLVKKGHSVRIVLTKGAEEFVNSQVYRYLGIEKVYTYGDDFNYPNSDDDKGTVLHIDLAKWADVFAIAPLSANTLSRMSRGEASDLLTSVFLSLSEDIPTLLFPAMNPMMLGHPLTQENFMELERLKKTGRVFIHPTAEGDLACGDHGQGKLPDVLEISTLIETITTKKQKNDVIITTGATLAPLDPVRYMTNASSGITGFHLACEFLRNGHQVTIIAGKFASSKIDELTHHPHCNVIRVLTTSDMANAVNDNLVDGNIYISAAAISDIEFDVHNQKMKKENMNDNLHIKRATDILQGVIEKELEVKTVGFAAETSLTSETLLTKFDRKPVDLLVGTKVHNGLLPGSSTLGFQVSDAEYSFVDKSKQIEIAHLSKEKLSSEIYRRIVLA